jgi:hypothetical protein
VVAIGCIPNTENFGGNLNLIEQSTAKKSSFLLFFDANTTSPIIIADMEMAKLIEFWYKILPKHL